MNIGDLIDVLKERAEPGAITEEVLSNIATSLAQAISNWESAICDGDITFRTLEERIYKQSDDEADKAIEAARTLLQTRYGERLKDQLTALTYEVSAVKAIMQAARSPVKGTLPKAARMYFCVDAIVAWKLIKNTDEIPGRELSSTREPAGEFFDFIEALLATAGGHVANVNTDELHKHILKVAKALEKTKTLEPEVIGLNDHPTGLWGK